MKATKFTEAQIAPSPINNDRLQPLGIIQKVREAETGRHRFIAQDRNPLLQQRQTICRGKRQSLSVRDKFRSLPGKEKILSGLGLPCAEDASVGVSCWKEGPRHES